MAPKQPEIQVNHHTLFHHFINGETSSIADKDFVRNIIATFQKKHQPDSAILSTILEALLPVVYKEESATREKATLILFHACNYFLDCREIKGLQCCAFIIREWLEEEMEPLSALEAILRELEKILLVIAKEKELQDVRESLDIIAKISNGLPIKHIAFQQTVSKSLARLCNDSFIRSVLHHPLDSLEHIEDVKSIITILGSVSIPALIARIAGSVTQREYDTLVALLFTFGDAVTPALIDYLQRRPSWAVVQTVIRLLGEIGDEAVWPIIEGYFDYPDIRVQQEALNTIAKFDLTRSRERFLLALPLIDTKLQIDTLTWLLKEAIFDEGLYTVLCLLVSRRATFPITTGLPLLSRILTGLKYYPRRETLDILEQMRREYRQGIGSEEISLLIDDAISNVAPQLRHSNQQQGEVIDTRILHSASVLEDKRLDAVEERIVEYLEEGDESGARDFIFDQALESISEKRYDLAEYLKNRLLEIDPFALAEVVKLGNRLEEQRLHAIPPQYAELWRELIDALSSDHFALLYQNSVHETYAKGEILVAKGDMDRSIFLINAGSVSLSCYSGGLERFLRRIGPGTILGGEQLFNASVWTVTLKALSAVEVMVIGHNEWLAIEKDAPQISEKLKKFCAKELDISELVTLAGDDRRGQSRYVLNTATRHQVLNSVGESNGEWCSGGLLDISRGGVAFSFHFASQEESRQFLGTHLRISLKYKEKFSLPFTGLVVGVRLLDPLTHAYSVHIRFAGKIELREFTEILQMFSPRSVFPSLS